MTVEALADREPRSALPERIADMVESGFSALGLRDKQELCRKWRDEYRDRPKRDDDEVDLDEYMSEAMERLAAEYQRMVDDGWDHPDDELMWFAAKTRADQVGGDDRQDAKHTS
jgi:hypothetical protein